MILNAFTGILDLVKIDIRQPGGEGGGQMLVVSELCNICNCHSHVAAWSPCSTILLAICQAFLNPSQPMLIEI